MTGVQVRSEFLASATTLTHCCERAKEQPVIPVRRASSDTCYYWRKLKAQLFLNLKLPVRIKLNLNHVITQFRTLQA